MQALSLVILAAILFAGCTAPVVIEGEAQAVAITDPAWRLHWKDVLHDEQTQTIAGREVTIKATSHVALWARDFQHAIVTASVPELIVFGRDVNPIALLADQKLAQFAITTALSQAGTGMGQLIPANPVLQSQQKVVVDAPSSQFSGTQFGMETSEGPVTVVILRGRSETDHIIVLGLLPNPLQTADWETFTSALRSTAHPVASLGEPEALVPDQITLSPEPVPPAKPGSGWLGVKVANVPLEAARYLGVETVAGAVVTDVLANSPAAQSGLRRHDLILAVNGTAVADAGDLVQRIHSYSPQAELVLRIWRQNSDREVSVRLAPLPTGNADSGL